MMARIGDAQSTADDLAAIANSPSQWLYSKLTDRKGREAAALRDAIREGAISLAIDALVVYVGYQIACDFGARRKRKVRRYAR